METTKSEHNHGGGGWEFGTCLWSPVTNSNGARFYEIMREPRAGDLVLHNYHFSPNGKNSRAYLCGASIVDAPVTIRTDEPPSPGDWAGRGQYYRINLRNFATFDDPLDFKVFSKNYSQGLREEIEHHRPKFYPFTVSGGIVRMNQGMYLTRISGILYSAFCDALGVEAADMPAKERNVFHRNYAEGERSRREVNYFQRNPELARDAKRHCNYTCQICGFSPLRLFGKSFESTALDCHHLDPMSERSDFSRESTIADVTVLCANCHRLVHSKRPALSIEDARKQFRQKPFVLGESL